MDFLCSPIQAIFFHQFPPSFLVFSFVINIRHKAHDEKMCEYVINSRFIVFLLFYNSQIISSILIYFPRIISNISFLIIKYTYAISLFTPFWDFFLKRQYLQKSCHYQCFFSILALLFCLFYLNNPIIHYSFNLFFGNQKKKVLFSYLMTQKSQTS